MKVFFQTCNCAALGALAGFVGMSIGVPLGQAAGERLKLAVLAGSLLSVLLVDKVVDRWRRPAHGRYLGPSRRGRVQRWPPMLAVAVCTLHLGLLLGLSSAWGGSVWPGAVVGALLGQWMPWLARMPHDSPMSEAAGGGFLGGFLGFFVGGIVSAVALTFILNLNGAVAVVVVVWWVATYVAAGVFIGVKLGPSGVLRAMALTVGGTIAGTMLTFLLGWLAPSLFALEHLVLVCWGLIGGTVVGALLSFLWACWRVLQQARPSEAD